MLSSLLRFSVSWRCLYTYTSTFYFYISIAAWKINSIYKLLFSGEVRWISIVRCCFYLYLWIWIRLFCCINVIILPLKKTNWIIQGYTCYKLSFMKSNIIECKIGQRIIKPIAACFFCHSSYLFHKCSINKLL